MAKIANIILLLFAVVLIAGCGSDSQSSAINQEREAYEIEEAEAEADAYEAEEETNQEEEYEEEVGGPLEYVGKITLSDEEGTTFSNSFSVGPLFKAEEGAPEEILELCFVDTPTEIASAVVARGEMTLSYDEGSLPVVPIPPTNWIGYSSASQDGSNMSYARMAINIDGEWHCMGNESNSSLEFQSGESQTFPFWIVAPQILSNAEPEVSPLVSNNAYFEFAGPLEVAGLAKETVRGPGAGWCTAGWTKVRRLFLYNRSGWCE